MSTMIETKNLTFTYPAEEGREEHPALRDVTLSVEKGSFTVVLGHNGSGKSTLAKQMNAVLLPDGGAVYVEGMDTRDEQLLLEIRRRVGMVFQNPDNQIVANVVEEDVAFAPENLGVAPAEIRQRVDDALAAVGMEEFARHAPHLLSGGQKQRVAIARALANDPKVILCDEATSALDPKTTKQILDLLKKINREMGVTVIVITHEMKVIEAICDRVAIIDASHIAECGAVSEVFSAPKTAIGKRLILGEDKGYQQVSLPSGKKLRLVFDGNHNDPIIAVMAKQLGVLVNIVFANLTEVEGRTIGQMIIELPDDETQYETVINFLKARQVRYEEVRE